MDKKNYDSDVLSTIGLYIKTEAHEVKDDMLREMLFSVSRLISDIADMTRED